MNTDSASELAGKTHLRARDLIPVWFMIAFFSVTASIFARGLMLQILNSEFEVGTWGSLSLVFYSIASVSLAIAFAFFTRSRLRGLPSEGEI